MALMSGRRAAAATAGAEESQLPYWSRPRAEKEESEVVESASRRESRVELPEELPMLL